jgi:subtilisin-like proprotein convertase family protein
VELFSPSGRRAILHGQAGGSANDIVATFDSSSPGVLTPLLGSPMQGDWLLRVTDLAADDTGVLRRWRLELSSSLVG